jgi:hypothetical protein
MPQVLEELRSGTIHLTGLFLLSTHLTDDNASALLEQARGKSRHQLEELIAWWFPRADVTPSIEPLTLSTRELLTQSTLPAVGGQTVVAAHPATCPRTGKPDVRGRLEPLSPARVRVEFTARAELLTKLERARELLSHTVPSGHLGDLFERALDALIEKVSRKRFGAGKPRKPRQIKPGSRHVPVGLERAVWERDEGQCTFVDAEGTVAVNGAS